jgi:hypothetical protein
MTPPMRSRDSTLHLLEVFGVSEGCGFTGGPAITSYRAQKRHRGSAGNLADSLVSLSLRRSREALWRTETSATGPSGNTSCVVNRTSQAPFAPDIERSHRLSR